MATTVLYGVNDATQAYVSQYDDINKFIIVTTNGGEIFDNQTALSLEEFAHQNFDEIEKVVICSSYVCEISNSLLNVGFPLEKMFFFDTFNVELEACSKNLRPQIRPGDILYAFYDLASNWVTFDVVAFAVIAEMERRKRGKSYIHFFIVPDRSCQRDMLGAQKCQSEEERSWRIDHILQPVFRCLPATISVSNLAFREEADRIMESGVSCIPNDFRSDKVGLHFSHMMLNEYRQKGECISVFEAPQYARDMVARYLDGFGRGRKPIVVNLREYDIQSNRNSRVNEWAKFVSSLDMNTYFPIVVRDSYRMMDELPSEFGNVSVFPFASSDYIFRVALFEQAYVSLSTTNGVFFITNFLRNTATINLIETDEDNPCMAKKAWERSGFKPGENSPLRDNDNQIIHWGADTYENILCSFQRLVRQMEGR